MPQVKEQSVSDKDKSSQRSRRSDSPHHMEAGGRSRPRRVVEPAVAKKNRMTREDQDLLREFDEFTFISNREP